MEWNIEEAKRRIRKCIETGAEKLNLSYLELDDLSVLPELQDCGHVKVLDLNFNRITDLSPLSGLSGMQVLNLGVNQITDLSPLSGLSGMQILQLDGNQITDLSPLSGLSRMWLLNLGVNQITDLSPLSGLADLQKLALQANQITDISPLYTLQQLSHLDVKDNQLSQLSPHFIEQFPEVYTEWINEGGLHLDNNPLTSPPIEIAQQGKEAILAWFAANKKALNEIKLILIGDPKAGKTSLLRQLQYGEFKPDEEQTDGINIERLSFGELATFKGQKDLHDLHAHCWDFGGQEIMSATHQFFLTNRSVYVLVLDARKDKEVAGQVRNWLQRIRQKGGDSKVLVVCNQIDVNPGFGFENEADLRREFPQILDFVKVSSKKGTGFKKFKDLLAEAIPEAELFKTEVDERWLPLKEDLQKETGANQYLNEDSFLSLCTRHQVAEEVKRNSAIQFLHDLGIVLHFPRINKQYFVLDPYWITFGVYQVITSKQASEQKGKLSKDDLDYIINKEQAKNKPYKRKGTRPSYSPSQCEFLMQILEEFKLAFYLKEEERYIIPDLLDTDEDKEAAAIRKAEEKLEFLYRYPVKPAALMPHLIVDLHSSLRSYWRTGCLLRHGSCTALISIYDREVRVFVCGAHKEKREFLSVIRYQIAKINSKLKYSPEQLIPVVEDLEPLDYEELIERERDGETIIKVFKPRKASFNIRELLDGIEEPRKGENEEKLLMKMEARLIRLQAGQDFATAEQLRMHTESQQERKAISEKQDALMGELQATRDYLYKRLGNEEYEGAVQQAIREMQAESQAHLAHDLMAFIREAAEISTGHLDEQMQQAITEVQQTDLVQGKLELGFPLLSLFGANLKAEVNLNELGKRVNEWSLRMQEQHGHKVFALLRKVWGG